ncbi:MAG: NPCBM/NEW2 domain-containing protein, partial [Candidatus Omnitrophica bacterium]|nr:NPCBM/NEW2 domain-containing protein [Candidatus Omnitrophota bacterium]
MAVPTISQMTNRVGLSFLLLLFLRASSAGSDIPVEAPNDSVMASTEEIEEVFDWADAVFSDKRPEQNPNGVELEVLRQDYASLSFGESCMETPLTLGDRTFEHGLGTHANSEIKVHLPADAKVFKSFVGIDNNFDTQGKHGSVEFSVEALGKEIFRSPTLRGSDQAFPVTVEIPEGANEILLKVDTTSDGPTCDQADWADAQIILSDGKSVWLDEKQSTFLIDTTAIPISFTYGGISSSELLKKWNRTTESKDSGDRIIRTSRWDDPETGLRLEVVASSFKRYPAVEWIAYFENRGQQDSPILENIQALDVTLRTGNTKRAAILHQIAGDDCSERSYSPIETKFEAGNSIEFVPVAGRSSNGTFPFFNFEYRDQGLIAAIGWSGQWAASLDRPQSGLTRLAAGMEQTHLLLHPGERIRTPRILLMTWKGNRVQSHNRFRRLMLFHYAPKEDGHPVRLPIVSQCFDRYSWTKPEWATEAGQINAARFAHDIGCDTHWLDAAWFKDGFPHGVGNWEAEPKRFPKGLKPVSDACHRMGLKFVLWFEPERVAAGSMIATEHPDFVFGGEKGGLFKLNDPEARRWLTELLSKR